VNQPQHTAKKPTAQEWLVQERSFLSVVALCFVLAAVSAPYAGLAMWVGFFFAAYSTVANDSIQTIGTFIASNRERPWWALWLWIGGIFVLTVGYSWLNFDGGAIVGDVSYDRLQAKGFEKTATEFHFLQVAAPLFLVIMTRLKMPVSTTFLILSSFAASGKSIAAVTIKSVSGYGLAFVCAVLVWGIAGPWMKKRFQGEAHPAWVAMQWLSSGALWSVWLMQDAANIAVYLPRSLNTLQFAGFTLTVLLGLGVLFRMGGERIQEVVEEKSHVVDVRAATVINVLFAFILYYFKIKSNIPMSTTWVFIGLLGGRELVMALRNAGEEGRTTKQAMWIVVRDLGVVTLGFLVSLLIAGAINPTVGKALLGG